MKQKFEIKTNYDLKDVVMIYDHKTGHWEFNKLSHPLTHPYSEGLSSIIVAKKLNKEQGKAMGISTKIKGFYITSPAWYYYIYFGLRLLFRIPRKVKTHKKKTKHFQLRLKHRLYHLFS